MLPFSETPEADIRAFVRKWLKLLADGKFIEACAQLDEPNFYGMLWTPQKILQSVNETFSPDTLFYRFHPEGPQFSDPNELTAQTERDEVIEMDDGGFHFDQDLPLNGEWSDLTALFEFQKRPDGFAVILEDLHVL